MFGFVLPMAFLLMLLTFRSFAIPVKAIPLNLLSVGAAFGVMTLVFQHASGDLMGLPLSGGIARGSRSSCS